MRRDFLKPSPLVTQIFTDCLAVAAERFGILLHTWVFDSTWLGHPAIWG